MGVVKKSKSKTEKKDGCKNKGEVKKDVANGRKADKKVKKKKRSVSCLQCIKSHDDGTYQLYKNSFYITEFNKRKIIIIHRMVQRNDNN